MPPTHLPLLDAAAARAGDQAAVEAGDTWSGLMERAAGQLARWIVVAGSRDVPGVALERGGGPGVTSERGGGPGVASGRRGYGLRVTLVVGKGNNGGDGWAAARRLTREHGARCWVVAVDGVDVDASDETVANRTAWLASGERTSAGTDHLDDALAWCDVAVDCLLGTGVSGAPRGLAGEGAAALLRAHAWGTTVVACDVPSGVSADDGSVPEGAVRADLTVTLGGLKRGLVLHPGAAQAGRVVVGDLGERYDAEAAAASVAGDGADGVAGDGADGVAGDGADGVAGDGAGRIAGDGRGATGADGDGGPGSSSGGPGPSRWWALTPAGAAPPPLAATAEKRTRGAVLGVAGAVGTSGAAALVADGALRAGAGLVSIATPEPVRGEVAARVNAGAMVHGVPADADGALAADAIDAASLTPEALSDADVVVAGPGLGHGPGAAAVVEHLRAHARRLVLDADALNVHRDDPAALADHRGELVLTPHERELARIGGGSDGPDAWVHRVERVPELARRLDATIVAKGPGTLVAAPDGRVWVTPVGGPALGSGGTGDVLAGVVGAAVAAADDVPLAVARAVWWHAAAGEVAGADRADRATATDLLAALPGVLGELAALSGVLGGLTGPRSVPAGTTRPEGLSGLAAARGGRAGTTRPGVLPWDRWRGERDERDRRRGGEGTR